MPDRQLREACARPEPIRDAAQERIRDEVYRRMIRLDAGLPGAEEYLAMIETACRSLDCADPHERFPFGLSARPKRGGEAASRSGGIRFSVELQIPRFRLRTPLGMTR